MFKFGVNCALEPVPESAPVVLRGKIESVARDAAKVGYDGLELFIRKPRQYDAAHLKSVADSFGIEFCSIGTGMEYSLEGLCLISDDTFIRAAAIDRLKEHIDLAAILGCSVVVGMMRGNIPDFTRQELYLDYLIRALHSLDDYASSSGVSLVVESIMRYISNYLTTVPETTEFLKRVGRPNIGLHIDSHLMNVEDKDIASSIKCGAKWLKYVHFSDSNRAYPGGGKFDFKEMMHALIDVGYTGYITNECQPYPNPYTCAERGLRYNRHLQALVEIERAPLCNGLESVSTGSKPTPNMPF